MGLYASRPKALERCGNRAGIPFLFAVSEREVKLHDVDAAHLVRGCACAAFMTLVQGLKEVVVSTMTLEGEDASRTHDPAACRGDLELGARRRN
jgi:hypothetical protein